MLVIMRKIGESIRINDDIVISILSSKAEAVKFGITAPKDVLVRKEETYGKLVVRNEDSVLHGA